jgi:transposase
MYMKTVVFEAIATPNGIEPFAPLTDVLERMVSGRTKAHGLERLLPWHGKAERLAAAAAVGT